MAIIVTIENPVLDTNGKLKAKINSIISPVLKINGEIHLNFHDLIPFANNSEKKVVDFLLISSYVYAIDRFVNRHENSVDGWSRELEVTLPVYEVDLWSGNSIHLEDCLSFLTGDYWKVNFIPLTLVIPKLTIEAKYNLKFSQVNLFSGGLDSLIGAIDFLETGSNLLLVSHYDPQMHGPKNDQKKLYDVLLKEYENRVVKVPSVEMYLKAPKVNTEKTFRSRSLLFLGISVLVAQFQKCSIAVPENGTVSLNYPLSSSRRSACSTRTTHPSFIIKIRKLLGLLGINNNIFNPYEDKTKGEMVRNSSNYVLLKSIVEQSNSCGKRGHVANWTETVGKTHCGICMPCIYRQASLFEIIDKTPYGNTINKTTYGKNDKPFFESKQSQDLAACLSFLKKDISLSQIKNELLINGVTNLSKINDYVALVERSRLELRQWFEREGKKEIKKRLGND